MIVSTDLDSVPRNIYILVIHLVMCPNALVVNANCSLEWWEFLHGEKGNDEKSFILLTGRQTIVSKPPRRRLTH